MNIDLAISGAALGVSLMSVLFVYWQIRKSTNTTKAELLTSFIDQIHYDEACQSMLNLIYRHHLETHLEQDTGKTRILATENSADVTEVIDRLLSRFQILGHLFALGVIDKRSLQTLRFEIVTTGRDPAIRTYLQYLNTEFILQSGIVHDHFEFFKMLYMKMEEDDTKRLSFTDCLFDGPEARRLLRRSAPMDGPGQEAESDAEDRAP